MAIPGVPAGARRRAFEAFVRELTQAPTLANRRVVKTWRTWDGKSATAPPTADQMPCVDLRLMPGEIRRLCSTRQVGGAPTWIYQATPTVAVELWTVGNDQRDAMDLADLMTSAIFPQDQAVRKAIVGRLKAAGVQSYGIAGEIAPSSPADLETAFVRAAGAYRLVVNFVS